jgi:hypothetical protein
MSSPQQRAKPVFFVSVLVLLVVFLVVAVFTTGRNTDETCLVVDMLRVHVPGEPPPPYIAGASEPVSFGTLCIVTKHQLVRWRIKETFRFAYGDDRISDLRLCGPLNNGSVVSVSSKLPQRDFAPVVLALGTTRGGRDDELTGSAIIDTQKMFEVLRNPTNYYMAIYVYEKRTNQQAEVGRSKLHTPNKK